MKCNDCEHKSEEDEYDLKICITCEHNPYVITNMFKAKEVEIRPENPGELWVNGNGKFYHTAILDEDLYLSGVYEAMIVNDHMDFKKWTRLYPLPEDKTVERIEIEGITWGSEGGWLIPFGGGGFMCRTNLCGKPPMKMILEIPK